MHPLIIYLGWGIIWTAFIEYLTSIHAANHPDVPEWSNRERVVQIVFWPVFCLVFIIKLFSKQE